HVQRARNGRLIPARKHRFDKIQLLFEGLSAVGRREESGEFSCDKKYQGFLLLQRGQQSTQAEVFGKEVGSLHSSSSNIRLRDVSDLSGINESFCRDLC